MKNKTGLLIIILVLTFAIPGWQNLQAESVKKEQGISFTWQDLQKILGIGDDKIKMSWQEFRQLLKQTGTAIEMDFELRDGVVTLKRQQFAQILKRMKPVIREIPQSPLPYLITKATYTGVRDTKTSQFRVNFNIYLFDQQKPTYMNIPILNGRVAISDLKVNDRPAVVRTRHGWYQVSLKGKGYHIVTASFSLTNNPNQLTLPIIKATTNRIEFSIPEKDLLITSPGSLQARVDSRANNTRFSAMLPAVNQVQIAWKNKQQEMEKKPALFYASSTTLISVAAEVVKARTNVQLEILQSTLQRLSILLPKHYEVIRVDAGRKNNWLVRATPIGRVLEIHFGYQVNRKCQFNLYLERSITAETLGVGFTGIKVLDARRESGSIGVVADSSVEVAVADNTQLEKLEYHQVPKSILNMSARPILNCFKYSKHPYQLDLTIQKHERLQGIATIIESAQATLLYLQEGKLLHQITYRIRNSFKQFMELDLPKGARIWSVLVDKNSEKASRNQNGKILIPLIRSGGKGDKLKSFLVELVYSMPIKRFAVKGNASCFLPKSDIFVNKMDLQIFLPHGYSYSFKRGEWKKKIMPIPQGVGQTPAEFMASQKDESRVEEKLNGIPKTGEDKDAETEEQSAFEAREKTKKEKRISKKLGSLRRTRGKKPASPATVVGGKYLEDGMDVADLTGPAGLNSVKVHLPLTGTKFAFFKKIIDKNETFPITISFIRSQLKLGIFLAVLTIFLLFGSFMVIKKLKNK